ncbi:hypothetical protein GCM10010981_31900 [Dyella nitratireducens]|uniref:Uncharacterized protein n=1 Tax=Dyella nitratireducens TaxID=1849580 RepID=A0ABQ1GB59_9GAMM|nr:hypothetical protein GCM10010981_31900 [Dyella nitratireducens]
MDSGLRRNDGEVLRNFPGQRWAFAGMTNPLCNGIDASLKFVALAMPLPCKQGRE